MDRKLNILIVDDEPDIRFLLSSILKRNLINAKVKTAKSVEDGLETIRANNFDIFFFDYRLGDGTGLDLLNEVQAGKYDVKPVIVFMSAYTSAEDVDKLIASGVDSFMPKPLDKNIILQTLSGVLND